MSEEWRIVEEDRNKMSQSEISSVPMAPSGGVAARCPGPPLSQRTARSSGRKQKFAVQKVRPEVRECRHTYTQEGFQAFCCCCCLITFQVFFLNTYIIQKEHEHLKKKQIRKLQYRYLNESETVQKKVFSARLLPDSSSYFIYKATGAGY